MQGKKIDLIGRTFGQLTVVSEYDITHYGAIRWNCLCACGGKTIVRSSHLTSGATRSCGCLAVKSKATPDSAYRMFFRNYRFSAKNHGRDFELSFEQCKNLFISPCYYCGATGSNTIKYGVTDKTGTKCNGIDRQDNAKGYIVGNVVPCCKTCNWMKRALGHDEFIEHVEKIYRHCRTNLEKVA